MPTTTITNEQRVGLYELVRNHLGALGDVWVAMESQRDFGTAERLGRQFAEDFRLLEDIGWHPGEERGAFELTMPVRELTRLLNRLHGEAEGLLTESPCERRSREEDEAANKEVQRGLDACEELLIGLDGREGEPA